MPVKIFTDDCSQARFAPLGSNLKVLLVWPRFPPSFWGFEAVLRMIPQEAVTPPLGLITVAALCPPSWTLRLLDCAFEEIRDDDYQWADLVMVSAMHAQRADTVAVLARARALGVRTFIGGPWASSEPELLRGLADHVMVGEAEEVFAEIAVDLEEGTARAVYRVDDKPDLTRSPIPRFDLLQKGKYTTMSVQLSRGCPFQCEFCDIITIYGRKPRLKCSGQVMAELDALRTLGWRGGVFIVDDNFIGNSKQALQLAHDLADWEAANKQPFTFFTEASIDLADRPELLKAMVEANFISVFVGVESPSAEALRGTKKFQNLRKDCVEQIRIIQQSGLWVVAGFIVGFDSDDETIFERQFEFVEQTAVPWAMVGMLQAPPTTPLFARMKQEGRLIEDGVEISNFSAPNFRTVMPLPVLMRGYSRLLTDLYEPEAYFRRSLRSLDVWDTKPSQNTPSMGPSFNVRGMIHSVWTQGVRSSYRGSYWRFVRRLIGEFGSNRTKMFIGLQVLMAAQHFVIYSQQVVTELEQQCRRIEAEPAAQPYVKTPPLPTAS